MATESPRRENESSLPGIFLLAIAAFLLWAAGPGRDVIATFMINNAQ